MYTLVLNFLGLSDCSFSHKSCTLFLNHRHRFMILVHDDFRLDTEKPDLAFLSLAIYKGRVTTVQEA